SNSSESERSSSGIAGRASRAGGLETEVPPTRTESEPTSADSTIVATPPAPPRPCLRGGGGEDRASALDLLQSAVEPPCAGKDVREPMRAVHAQQLGHHGPTKVGLDDRHTQAGFALDEGKPGNDRGLAIAGIGAHDQDRARGA